MPTLLSKLCLAALAVFAAQQPAFGAIIQTGTTVEYAKRFEPSAGVCRTCPDLAKASWATSQPVHPDDANGVQSSPGGDTVCTYSFDDVDYGPGTATCTYNQSGVLVAYTNYWSTCADAANSAPCSAGRRAKRDETPLERTIRQRQYNPRRSSQTAQERPQRRRP